FLWAHIGWLLFRNPETWNSSTMQKYSRDILEDPFYMRLEKIPWLVLPIYVAHALVFFAAGFLFGGLDLALSLLVWGVFVRTIVVWHLSWSVNSFTHVFGYRNYETDDRSRNNPIVAILTSGEGWHNNHHEDQRSATNQRRWWEFDLTYWTIRLLERIGLASDVVRPRTRPVGRPASAPEAP
ncbi:MAG: acyl-CoA desaturase, partial [Planctomycetota bacterium]